MQFDQWRRITNRLEQETEQPFGLWPSPPDPRDFQYSVFAGTTPLPPRFYRDGEMPPVRDQRHLGTCVGHAMWAMKEWQERQQGDVPVGGLSPRFIYQMCKQLDGQPNVAGTYPRVAAKVLQDYGDCPETVFPYTELTTDVNLPPPPQAVLDAAKPFRISVYTQVKALDELKRAIVEQGPVPLALFVTQSFMDAKEYVPEPAGTLYGGHAVLACAYDDTIRLGPYQGGVKFVNSWGKSWGIGGYSWIPYAAWLEPWWIDIDLKWPFVTEMWAAVDLAFTLSTAKQIILMLNEPTAYVDGQFVSLDVPPTLVNDRTMLPIRFVAERMGYIVNWQQSTNVVELRRPW